MNNYQKINTNIKNIFSELTAFLYQINADNYELVIYEIFIIITYMIVFFRKVIFIFCNILDKYIKYNDNYDDSINSILGELDLYSVEILTKFNKMFSYNNISYENIINNNTSIESKYNKYLNSNIVKENKNLDIIDINSDNINNLLVDDSKKISINSDSYEYINIGFGNMYKLHAFNNLGDSIPLNLLVYVKEIEQVVIKIGTPERYKYINSKLYKMYDIKNKVHNDRSILCNNNIKMLGKKCQNGIQCKYYHDIILGYTDNAHFDRQFSHNPIIYNCMNFKDGVHVKENVKKIDWVDAINLYQSNLSCILIACIHSLKK